jgi:hypothetical protein
VSCRHENFAASCDVTRVLDGTEGGDLTAFAFDVRVTCADCGEAFGFRGVPCGVSVNGQPMRSADALELRAWLLSPSELALAERDGPPGIVAP